MAQKDPPRLEEMEAPSREQVPPIHPGTVEIPLDEPSTVKYDRLCEMWGADTVNEILRSEFHDVLEDIWKRREQIEVNR